MNSTINIEKIMDEIRLEIQSKIFDEIEDFEESAFFGINGLGSSDPFDKNDFLYELSVSSQSYVMPTSFPVEGKFKLIKKAVRKFSFFITRQLAAVLTEYNCHIIRMFNQVRNYIFEQEKSDAEQKKCISEMTDLMSTLHSHSGKIRKISSENRALTEKVAQLEKNAEAYRNSLDNSRAQMEILKERLEVMEQRYQMSDKNNK